LGRDLCSLCDERDKRNVFLEFTAEKKRRQKEYEDMMLDYQRKKKEMDDLKDSLVKKSTQEYTKEQSCYNWNVADKKVRECASMVSCELLLTTESILKELF